MQLQAACGFRAFAERRLWATEIEDAELGMDARESGTVVHRALELFWNEVQDAECAEGDEPRRSRRRCCVSVLMRL